MSRYMNIGRALASPPDDPALTLAEARANLAPELELRELWDILARLEDEKEELRGLSRTVENLLLERVENWGP